MTKAFYIFIFLFVTYFHSFSQISVNDYKYVIVPAQFEFLNTPDQYDINSLTKFLFNKYGYTAFFNNEDLPQDLRDNMCLGLTANVVKESAFLKTKLRIDLKDCKGIVVISSKTGETREKMFAKAYNFALRDAFETFQNFGYAYQPIENILSKTSSHASANITAEKQEEIARLKEEIEILKEKQVPSEGEKTIVDTQKAEEPRKVSTTIEKLPTMVETKELKSEVLYAQSIENGFQIVDSTPKVVMILLPTGAKDVFTVKDKNAIVFKKDGHWIYSENDGTTTKESKISIKF